MSKPPFFQMYRRSPETERDSSSVDLRDHLRQGAKILLWPFFRPHVAFPRGPFYGGYHGRKAP